MATIDTTQRLCERAKAADEAGQREAAIAHYDDAIQALQQQYASIARDDTASKVRVATALQHCHDRRLTLLQMEAPRIEITPRTLQTAMAVQSAATQGVHKAGGGKTVLGSAAAGAGLGLCVAGPLGLVAGAVGGAVLTAKDGAVTLRERRAISSWRQRGPIATAQELDAKYKIKDTTARLLETGLKHATVVNEKYHLTDCAAKATVSGINKASEILRDKQK
ncbi:hypothetical protein SPRG_12298 [Saprolegnia parasitica CBS 223.65]|uniref:MIT domain-containing protein n=1 Tax=Saprolegnia parasitica (strain CBS 223.65) TaxID=695850 RepID=A0A067BUQ3_SAPPC|nr:hypothetical protein SPRG_12298 [Saprolegnia parasitica CBS 223.65]KDO22214.1 hypothetical protein SPRG_12298 [Saprolegnia parasitica CBS 223.65]|eukprot:XP_012207055.1 hypothetical protein SPRG_12298 [Saprolegnia parasitica CBS 223.65]